MAAIGAYGEALYQQVLPLHGPDPDGLLHDYIGAIAHPFVEIDELVRDTPEGCGWSVILDVAACPTKGLRWLSQIAGVVLRPQRATETLEQWDAYARAAIVEQAGHKRGTLGAQISAVKDTLTGSKSVRMIERVGGNAWQQTLITRTAETPSPSLTLAAWLTQKPAGIVATHTISDDPLWLETTKVWSGVAAGEHWDTLAVGDV
jgi:hypothetical protein